MSLGGFPHQILMLNLVQLSFKLIIQKLNKSLIQLKNQKKSWAKSDK